MSLPEGYRLQRAPDVPLLLRSDGLLVAAFSARGAAEWAVETAAWEDHEGARPRGMPKFVEDPF